MARKAVDVYRDALALNEEEREELIRLLAARPDDGWESPQIEQAWREECDRRVEAMDRGEMELIPAEEVYRRVRARLGD